MTDRPILFSAPMVRAILYGRKTQTRRVMKVQPQPDASVTVEHYYPTVIDRHGDMQPGKEIFGAHWNDGEQGLRCPYGAPGDTLWVRETWRVHKSYDSLNAARVYGAMGGDVAYCVDYLATPRQEDFWGRGRPSIHMPRWASRITLRITDIRVERLHDISEEDAKAEGADFVDYKIESCPGLGSYKEGFTRLWRNINGFASLIENPCVWVVAFERMKP
jgi:hypothetical protein